MSFTLAVNDRRGVSGFAQGGIYRESIIYTADADIPANAILRISPALFDQVHQSKQVEDTDLFWYFSWSATPATYTCSRNFDNKYSNIIVKVQVFTARIFEIKVEWMALADTQKYLYPYPFQPLKLWENQSVNKSVTNVYNSAGQSLGIRLSIKDDPASSTDYLVDAVTQQDNPAQGIPWEVIEFPSAANRFYLEVDGRPASGYVIGEDLTVRLRNFPRYTNCQYFAGIYRVDQLLNQNLAFNYELFMEYAKANNSAAEPFELTTNKISRAYLKDMHGFRYDHLESIADFTIDADYFESGASYRLFVITKEECQYRSYLFDPFTEQGDWQSPTGDSNTTGIIVDGESLDLGAGSCLYNVPTGCEISVTMEFDTVTYNTDLGTKGLPGLFADYYKRAECYISDDAAALGVEVDRQVITDALVGDLQTTTYSFKIPTEWAGSNKYINIGWVFEYPNGQIDHLTNFILLNVIDDDSLIIKTPEIVPDEICAEDASDTEYCFQSENVTDEHLFFIDPIQEGQDAADNSIIEKVSDDFSVDSEACVNMKFTEANIGQEYCMNMRAWKLTNEAVDDPCSDPVRVNLKYVLARGNSPIGTIPNNTFFEFEIEGVSDLEVLTASFRLHNDVAKLSKTLTFKNKATDSKWYGTYLEIGSPILIDINITKANGHVYIVKDVVLRKSWAEVDSVLTVDMCELEDPVSDCEHNPILSSTVTWNYIAPPTYGSILNKTVTAVETDFGSPTTVTKYKIINGVESAYTGAFTTGTYNSVALRYELEYDGCDTIELYECLTFYEASIP